MEIDSNNAVELTELYLDNFEEFVAISLIHQTVVEDPVHLMYVQTDEFMTGVCAVWGDGVG